MSSLSLSAHSIARSISVRDLVPNSDPVRSARSESSLHRAYQAKLARKFKSFRSEVHCAATITFNSLEIRVTGRLDGIRKTRNGWILTEIKPVDSLEITDAHPDLERALWQLQLYADLVRAGGIVPATAGLLLELILLDSSAKARALSVAYDRDFEYLRRRLATHYSSDRKPQPWPEATQTACDRLEVFDRPAQIDAWQALGECGAASVLLALPPGTGKTRLALRWAIQKAIASSSQVVWITAKARGRETVLAEVAALAEHGVDLTVVWKTTRERLCPHCREHSTCSAAAAQRLSQFFGDSLNFAPTCDFERMRYSEANAHLIIADLNYVLAPSSLWNKRAVFVIDEAQHWADRARGQSEFWLPNSQLRQLKSTLNSRARAYFAPILASAADESPSTELWADFLQTVGLSTGTPNLNISAQQATVAGEHGWYVQIGDPASNMLAGVQQAVAVLALSGSLPANNTARKQLFPIANNFALINSKHEPPLDIRFVPLLDFRFPLTLDDHREARDALIEVSRANNGTLLVMGQSRESNAILYSLLASSGLNCIFADDVGDDWQLLTHVRPDIVFASLGSAATESVNPPADVFSMIVVLSAGLRPPSPIDELRAEWSRVNDSYEPSSTSAPAVAAASRIIQAVGRVNRSPERLQPALLLDRRLFAQPFAELWPDSWRNTRGQLVVYHDLASALDRQTDTQYA